MSKTPEQCLIELGIDLPPACKPAGNYRPALIVGNFLYVSGHTPDDARPDNFLVGKVSGKFGDNFDPLSPLGNFPEWQSGRIKDQLKTGDGWITPDSGDDDVVFHHNVAEAAGLADLMPGEIVEFQLSSFRPRIFVSAVRSLDRPYTPKKADRVIAPEQAYQAARDAGLAILSTVREALGSLDRVKRLVKATGLVNCTPDFAEHPKVMNGFSNLMAAVFGLDNGVGTRSATGASSLPGNVAVEVTECVFEIKRGKSKQ